METPEPHWFICIKLCNTNRNKYVIYIPVYIFVKLSVDNVQYAL
jgi:hypothetical protein